MHDKISILDYYDLSQKERAALRAGLRNERLSKEFGDIDTLHELFSQARAWDRGDVDDELIVYLEVSRHFGFEELPPDVSEKLIRVKEAVEQDASLARRAAEIRERVDGILASINLGKRFERVSGHTLADVEKAAETYRRRDPGMRPPGKTPLYVLFAVVAAAVFLGIVYAGLFMATRSATTPLQRAAPTIDVSDYRVPGPMRGSDRVEEARVMAARLYEAATLLDEARTSKLGLFARVDEQKIAEASAILAGLSAAENIEPWLQAEAEYLKGVASMLSGDGARAVEHFRRVIDREGRHSREAFELIQRIEALEE